MLDSDLAVLYQTETKFVNRAVKRNPLRFPNAFIFQLTEKEWTDLKYQSGTSSEHGERRTLPYVFVADIIKKAKSDIILIDNYVDETVLSIMAKRKKTVTATIYTKSISKQLQLDLDKHNSQYPSIAIKTFANSHDRFLIIDQKELYHLGASLKDLGKKWFAFSKMDSLTADVLAKLKSTK
jgi:hypothetical protein